MAKSADAFRTISEVADWLETPAHVLRFWESKFSQVKPVKRAGGRRYYRPADMKLLGGIKKLLHEDGLTIKGVQKILREKGVKHVAGFSQPLGDATDEPFEGTVQDAAEDDSATVLNFRRTAGAQPAEPAAPTEPEPVAAPPEPEPTPEPPQVTTPEPPEPEPTPEVAADSPGVTSGDIPATDDDTDMEPEPELEPEPPATMPSFSHRKSAETPPASPPEPEPTPEPEPPAPSPASVDVPDDPANDVAADPGVLGRLANLPRPLSPAAAARLAPILERLKQHGAGQGTDRG